MLAGLQGEDIWTDGEDRASTQPQDCSLLSDTFVTSPQWKVGKRLAAVVAS